MNFLYAILPQITTGIIVGVVVFLITRYKIDPELAKRDKKKKHQEVIFGIYEKWLESPFSYKVDLTDFNLDKLNIAFKESFPTILINQDEDPRSVEEQALYHLYQENNDSFTKYKQILEKKNEFNKNIEKFLNKIKKDLINILKSKGLEKYEELIDSPLRFYLVKMNNCINTEEGYIDHILENERAYLKQDSIENKTFQISKEQLISLMKTNKVDDIESIKKLKENVEELDKLILEFQNSLKLVTSAKILGLTSSCIIEKKLSNKNRLRSLFHRKKPRSQ